jgi:amidase
MFETALERAAQLDSHLTDTGTVIGPLHGLPISLKNQISVKGVEMNMCYVGQVGEIAQSDSTMASILLAQGAVLCTLTNLSQGLLSTDTVNNLYGRTVSPFNPRLCVGGSSGGEGGLLATHGSPLGIGSDLGGSVR